MRERPLQKNFQVLLIGNSLADAQQIEASLSSIRGKSRAQTGSFTVSHAMRLKSALEELGKKSFDAILLDLQLTDSTGLAALRTIRKATPKVPIIALTDNDDEDVELKTLQEGAQDCLTKTSIDGQILVRTLRHAIQRKQIELELLSHTREVEAARARIEQQAGELKERAEQLDQINRELDDFTYIASHDLKEPLRGISAYCQILLEDYQDNLDEDGQRRLNSLNDMCDRLVKLIDNLLTYCQIGRVSPSEQNVDMNILADELLSTLRPAIDQRRATVQLAGQLPTVQGNPTLISIVLSNLIFNGLKFNERRPRIEIGTSIEDPSEIYVRDNGIGIDSKHYDSIFTIFRRLHSRKKYEGTGAGLTICRKIVESHGGRIWLESEIGRGTTFYFTLCPTANPDKQPSTTSPYWSKKLTLLDPPQATSL